MDRDGGHCGSGLAAWFAVVGVCLTAAVAVSYAGIVKWDLSDPAIADVQQYMAIYRGHRLSTISKPFRYRIVVPLAARALPTPPRALIPGAATSRTKIARLKFGVVDVLSLTIAGTALFAMLEAMGFAPSWCILGAAFFYLSFWVVFAAGLPLVDAGAFAALAAGCAAAATRRTLLLGAVVLVGMFVKESTALVPCFALLLPGSRHTRIVQVAASAPGLLAYAVVRLLVLNGGGYGYSLADTLGAISTALHPKKIVGIVVTFGVLWVLAAVGLRRGRRARSTVPASLAWLVAAAAVLALVNASASSFGRVLFFAFPAVIPLALDGLESLFVPAGAPSP